MKIINQLGIILLLYFIGELIVYSLQIKIPGSIVGMLLLLISLQLNIIKVKAVKEVATFFMNNMMIFFIPLGVGLMTQWDIISQQWASIVIATIASTFIVLLFIGLFIRKKNE